MSDHLTTDPADPRLTHGADTEPVEQADAYLVLSEEERARGFVRPVRRSYRHAGCDTITTLNDALSEMYARYPEFYPKLFGQAWCETCRLDRPVGEFVWTDGSVVGS